VTWTPRKYQKTAVPASTNNNRTEQENMPQAFLFTVKLEFQYFLSQLLGENQPTIGDINQDTILIDSFAEQIRYNYQTFSWLSTLPLHLLVTSATFTNPRRKYPSHLNLESCMIANPPKWSGFEEKVLNLECKTIIIIKAINCSK